MGMEDLEAVSVMMGQMIPETQRKKDEGETGFSGFKEEKLEKLVI